MPKLPQRIRGAWEGHECRKRAVRAVPHRGPDTHPRAGTLPVEGRAGSPRSGRLGLAACSRGVYTVWLVIGLNADKCGTRLNDNASRWIAYARHDELCLSLWLRTVLACRHLHQVRACMTRPSRFLVGDAHTLCLHLPSYKTSLHMYSCPRTLSKRPKHCFNLI